MKLFNKCKVCGENVGLFNTELENPNDWAYDDYEKDKALGFSIVICPSGQITEKDDANEEIKNA